MTQLSSTLLLGIIYDVKNQKRNHLPIILFTSITNKNKIKDIL